MDRNKYSTAAVVTDVGFVLSRGSVAVSPAAPFAFVAASGLELASEPSFSFFSFASSASSWKDSVVTYTRTQQQQQQEQLQHR